MATSTPSKRNAVVIADTVTVSGNVSATDLTLSGNLTVSGTTTTLNTATLQVQDKNIVLNYGTGDTSGSADGAGITIQDAVSSTTDATILWGASDDRFNFSHMVNIETGGLRSTGSTSDGNAYSGIFRKGDGSNVLLIRNDGVVIVPSNYFYVTSTQGAYIEADLRVRGSLLNDTSGEFLKIDDSTHITGTVYLGSTATASDQLATNNGTDIFLGTSSKGLRTYKDLHTNSGNNKYWHAGNDGASSGLDADLLDGQHGSSFWRSDTSNNGAIRFNTTEYDFTSTYNPSQQGVPMSIRLWDHYTQTNAPATYGQLLDLYGRSGHWRHQFHMLGTDLQFRYGTYPLATAGWSSWYTQWHSGNDGASSGLDADLLDGQHGSYYRNASNINAGTLPEARIPTISKYLRSDTNDTATGKITFQHNDGIRVSTNGSNPDATTGTYEQGITIAGGNMRLNIDVSSTTNGGSYLQTRHNSSTYPNAYYPLKLNPLGGGVTIAGNTVWHAGNDGTGSGLDADTLDSHQASSFLRSDTNDTYTGTLSLAGNIKDNGDSRSIRLMHGTTNSQPSIGVGEQGTYGMKMRWDSSQSIEFDGFWSTSVTGSRNRDLGDINVNTAIWSFPTGVKINGSTAWHAGNDGPSSGLDADLLDGQHGSYYLNYNNFNNTPSIPSVGNGTMTISAGTSLSGGGSFTANQSGNSTVTINVAEPANTDANWRDVVAWNGQLVKDTAVELHGSGYLRASYLNMTHGVGTRSSDTVFYSSTDDYIRKTNAAGMRASLSLYTTSEVDALIPTIPSNNVVEGGTSYSGEYPMVARTSANTIYSHNGIKFNGAQEKLTVGGSVVINGSTSWHAGNDGPGSGLDADTVDGKHASDFMEDQFLDSAYVDFTVNGDADTYYPVSIRGGGKMAFQMYSISRQYNWTAPNTWYTSTHRGGLTLTWQHSGDGFWGGNDHDIRIIKWDETYSTIVAGMGGSVGGGGTNAGVVVWLRGGGALYRFHGPQASAGDVNIHLTSVTASNSTVFAPRSLNTTTRNNELLPKYPIRNQSELYDNNNRVWHAGNDGPGSGLDADTVDSIQASSFLRSDTADTGSGKITLTATEGLEVGGIRGRAIGDQTGDFIQMYERVSIGYPSGWGATAAGAPAYGLSTWGGAEFNKGNISGAPLTFNSNAIWHAGNDGPGSGLDADTVDGVQGASLLRSDVNDSFSGQLTMSTQKALIASNYGHGVYGIYSPSRYQHVWSMGTSYNLPANGVDTSGAAGNLYGLAWTYNPDHGGAGNNLQAKAGLNHQLLLMMNGTTYTALGNGIWTSGGISRNGNTVWDAGNDGPGSGLDADTVDSLQASQFLRSDADDTASGKLTLPKIFLNRQSSAGGLNFYSAGYKAWTMYMSPTGAGQGPNANITAPSGSLVTSWALRSFIENAGGYGWTFESGTSTGNPSVVAEIRSSDGSAVFNGWVRTGSGGASYPTHSFKDDTDSGMFSLGSNAVGFGTGGTQRFKINSNGLLLTGTSSLYVNGQETITNSRNIQNVVNITNTDGYIEYKRTGAAPAIFNRLGTGGASGTSRGEIVNFKSASTKVGRIGYAQPYGGIIYLAGGQTTSYGVGVYQFSTTSYFQPCTYAGANLDDVMTCGGSGARWTDVYSTNGTIQTSDRNEKQDIQELTDAETRVATVCKGLIRRYRWISSVEEKGDNARYHFGAIAQDVEDAFTAEGLNAGDYALFIKNTWWDYEGDSFPTAEAAPTGAVEKTRLGIRYNQLLAFIISAL